jgi:3-oxoacyl-[acyl-carrier protein] reductase
MIDLHNRVALVTGGSKGLGAAIVRQLAAQGASVAFTYLHDTQAAERLAADVQSTGGRCMALQADARDFDRAHGIVSAVCDAFGSIHILVYNAGTAYGAALHKMTEQQWDDATDISLKGNFAYMHAVAPIYIKQTYGKIVCIGSINGLRGRIGSIGYNAAKAGQVGLVKTAAAELGRYNVNVNLVAPGFIETPSQTHTPELIRDLVLKECAIKRLGTPEDIAPVVVFLCSDAAGHVTGQIIKVDAGQYL